MDKCDDYTSAMNPQLRNTWYWFYILFHLSIEIWIMKRENPIRFSHEFNLQRPTPIVFSFCRSFWILIATSKRRNTYGSVSSSLNQSTHLLSYLTNLYPSSIYLYIFFFFSILLFYQISTTQGQNIVLKFYIFF